jgi:hypothetical protein
MGFAAGLRRLCKFYDVTCTVLGGLNGPLDTGYAGFTAMMMGDQRIQGFRATNVSFPGLRVCIADLLRVAAGNPGIKAVVPACAVSRC